MPINVKLSTANDGPERRAKHYAVDEPYEEPDTRASSVEPLPPGSTLVICASGPSFDQEEQRVLAEAVMSRDDVYVLAVNATAGAIPWADFMYATDPGFFNETRVGEWVLRHFKGRAFTQSRTVFRTPDDVVDRSERVSWVVPSFRSKDEIAEAKASLDVELVRKDTVAAQERAAKLCRTAGFDERPFCVRTGSNSGYAAVSLGRHMTPARILLCGYDMRKGEDGREHYHHGGHVNLNGSHRSVVQEPVLSGWAAQMAFHAEPDRRGIEILNTSLVSAIKAFPKVDLVDALREEPAQWQ